MWTLHVLQFCDPSMKSRSSHNKLTFILVATLALATFAGLFLKNTAAQTSEELAQMYAPALKFTGGEKFFPTSVDYVIGSSVVKFRNSGGSSFVVSSTPTPSDLGFYTSTSYFLDNKLETFEAIADDYASKKDTLGYYAYVHVADTASGKVIEYWLFYIYNNGPLNDHQGDIEVVQVFLDSSNSPIKALYSQHSSGQNADWGDVEKDQNTHPIVYVAQGSHANYFRSYQGKLGIENDIVGDGKTIKPDELTLVMLVEGSGRPADQSWLDFGGRWGYWGTGLEVGLGMAGPVGPVHNQNGVRWAQPYAYLSDTFGVNGNYFLLSWIVVNAMLFFLLYVLIRAVWKIYGIYRMHKKGGLLVGKFLKSRGSIGLILGIVAIFITLFALALPWYNVAASSESGPLSGQGPITLLNIDGVHGMQVNLFLGASSDSTSGYKTLFFMAFPFALFIGVGLILLALDVIGVKNGKGIGFKFILGAITSLLPFVLILVFMAMLPNFLPWAASLVPGQGVPPALEHMIGTIAGNPFYGTMSETFEVVGFTTVTWGFGIGAYLFVVAAVLRVIAGFIVRNTPELQPPAQPTTPESPPSPPVPEQPKQEPAKTEPVPEEENKS